MKSTRSPATLAAALTVALTVSVAGAAPPDAGVARGGLGGYRLGMSPAEVQAVRDCAPYRPVPSTGGLECPAFEIAGKRRNISFVFEPTVGLRKIQVWFYEGRDPAAAEAALRELISYLEQEYGALESNSLPPGAPVTAKALRAVVDKPATAGALKAQLKPVKNPLDKFVFASLIHAPTDVWYLFYYVQPPR
jgi:hypothetical protein